MELMKIDGINKAVAEIATTLDSRKSELEQKLNPYINGVVTGDTLPAWKKDRATINKERTSTKKERTTLEAEWKALLAPISDTYKDMDAIYGKAIGNIDKQMDEFEWKRIEEKKHLIAECFDDVRYNCPDIPDEIRDWLTCEKVYVQKWENKGVSIKDIRNEIEWHYKNLAGDITILKAMNHKYEAEGLKVLQNTMDLHKAIDYMNTLLEQEKVIKAKEEPKPVTRMEKPVEELVQDIKDLPFGLPEEKRRIIVECVDTEELLFVQAILDNAKIIYEVE